MKIFGIEIGKSKEVKQTPSPIKSNDAVNVSSMYGIQEIGIAQYNGGENLKSKIKFSWDLYNNSEVAFAVDEIINELVDFSNKLPIKISLTSDKPNEKLAKEIEASGERMFSFFNKNLTYILKKWYIQGAVAYFIQLDEKGKNIVELKEIDVWDLKYVIPQKTLRNDNGIMTYVEEEPYWIYTQNDGGVENKIKLEKDSIIWLGVGLEKIGKVKSYLDYAVKPMNDLLTLENASVIYRITRAPEKRVFYVDTGQLSPAKAEEQLQTLMNRFKSKTEYDTKTGKIKTSNRNVIAATIDYFMPRREGSRGTEIDIVNESGNAISNITEEVSYFKSKLYQALFIPKSRVTDEPTFNVGASGMISREEIKFSQLISKLENEFMKGVKHLIKIDLILQGIVNEDEWLSIEDDIELNFVNNDFFAESKNLDVLRQRLDVLRDAVDYEGKYFTRDDILKSVLNLNENEISELYKNIDKERSEGLYDEDI